jgi:hypothetical protein
MGTMVPIWFATQALAIPLVAAGPAKCPSLLVVRQRLGILSYLLVDVLMNSASSSDIARLWWHSSASEFGTSCTSPMSFRTMRTISSIPNREPLGTHPKCQCSLAARKRVRL